MTDCLFCKIVKQEIPSKKVFENESVYAFIDINPMAKEHYLFIHKDHSTDINELTSNNPIQLKDVFVAINEFTTSNELASNGFRVVTNQGTNGGQTVFHTHFHVLGGEQLSGFGA